MVATAEVGWQDQVVRCLESEGHTRPVIGDRSLMEGGFSRSTWRLAVDTDDGQLDLVASVSDHRGAVQPGESLPRAAEGRLLRALAAKGAPVPVVHGARDHGDWGLVVMDHVDGETRVRPALKDERFVDHRETLAASLAESLVRIHRSGITPEMVGMDPVAPDECADRARARWRRGVEAMAPGPRRTTLADALDELDSWPVPPPSSVVVVHGDFRLGNVAYTPEGVRAVLDWEMAHFGDPVEDVAWPLLPTFRFGTDLVCGLVPASAWVAEYGARGGWPVGDAALGFWTTLGLVKMTCLNERSIEVIADVAQRSVLERQAQDLLAALEVALATGPVGTADIGGGTPDEMGGPRT